MEKMSFVVFIEVVALVLNRRKRVFSLFESVENPNPSLRTCLGDQHEGRSETKASVGLFLN